MPKTFATRMRVPKVFGLLFLLAAFLVLYSLTGCSADKHIIVTSGHTIDNGLSGPGDPQAAIPLALAKEGAAPTGRWIWYRDFGFDSNQTNLRVSDANKVFEVATYMKANPSLKVGLDASIEPVNQDLSDQRVAAVREALIEAGVPTARIQAGAFTDSKSMHDGRVAVLVRTVE